MKISLNWLRQYVELPDSLTMDKLAYDVTMRTVEVEGTHNPGDALRNVVVGKILSVAPHPEADRLRICQVDVGQPDPSTVVCGGSNVALGMLVVVAIPGSFVRWHGQGEVVEIKSAKLRGVKSDGMICAAGELDLGDLFPARDDHEIMDISQFDCRPGDLAAEVLQLNDVILEIDNKSMTNRPDLWGHYGIARELAAIYGLPLQPLAHFAPPKDVPAYPVRIEDAARCPRYLAAVYEGLAVAPSPYWMQVALWKCGVRPINNLVDITNYVMLAVGQPSHAFDRQKVPAGIVIRPAQPDETLTLLDGQKLALGQDDLMICDNLKPIALAGVMGGAQDSIAADTQGMVLEIANFEPVGIRRTASRYHIRTEAAIRFEKGLDTQRVQQAMVVAHELLRQLCPGVRLAAYNDQHPAPTQPEQIVIALDWLAKRLGRPLPAGQAAELLQPLGFGVREENGLLQVETPTWRSTGDVSMPDDVLEEIARMIGYENYDYLPPTVTLQQAVRQIGVQAERAVREYLARQAGMQEIFTYPWVDETYIRAAGIPLENCLALATPPSPQTAHLRASLIPGMLEAVVTNLRYYNQFSIFELTQVFAKGDGYANADGETLPSQQRHLAAALVGEDARLLLRKGRGILEALPRAAMVAPLHFVQIEAPAWADQKAWLNIVSDENDKQVIGSLGVLSPKAARLCGIKRAQAALFELNMEKVQPLPSRANTFAHLPRFPLVEQDFSVLLDEKTTWQELEETVGKSVQKIEFIEEYRGKQVPEGKKSLMFRVWFGSDEGTLSAGQIDEKMNAIIKKISKRLGGEIRT